MNYSIIYHLKHEKISVSNALFSNKDAVILE